MRSAPDDEQIDHKKHGKHHESDDFKSKGCFGHDTPSYEVALTCLYLFASVI